MFTHSCSIPFAASTSRVLYKHGIDNRWVYFAECVTSTPNRKPTRKKADEINTEAGLSQLWLSSLIRHAERQNVYLCVRTKSHTVEAEAICFWDRLFGSFRKVSHFSPQYDSSQSTFNFEWVCTVTAHSLRSHCTVTAQSLRSPCTVISHAF